MRVLNILLAALLLPSLTGCPESANRHRVECDPGAVVCTTPTARGDLRFEISPRPIPLMTAFDVFVDTAASTDQIIVKFNGRDMEMGPNQIRLQSTDGLRWQGRASLPVCISGRMRWQAEITVGQGATAETLQFEFSAGPP